MLVKSSTGIPTTFCWLPWLRVCLNPFAHLGGERHRESIVSCPRTRYNDPGQGSNPDCWIQSSVQCTNTEVPYLLWLVINLVNWKILVSGCYSVNSRLNKVYMYIYYTASSVSGQDESNPALWLATQVGKMELSCPLGTTHRVPQEKFPQKPYNKSFIEQACSVNNPYKCM